jgi:prepilin peptidase CpaA
MGVHAVAWWPVCVVVAVACVTDLQSRRIPNWLVFPFLVLGFVVTGSMHGWNGLLKSVEGFGLSLALTGILYCMRGMGMGDVKLCAAIGAWVGPGQAFVVLIITALAGGVMALAWAFKAGFIGDLLRGSGDVLVGVGRHGLTPHPEINLNSARARKMPYAPAIACGALLSFFAQ